MEWARYDVANGRTIYGANPAEARYAETLAAQRVAESISTMTLGDLFQSEGSQGLTSVLDAVQQEWRERHHIDPHKIVAGWRSERLVHELQLPRSGWFVDIETAESISAVMLSLAAPLLALGIEQLTVGHLRGEDRLVTTQIAEWLREQLLDDGSVAHGIVYGSKHSTPWTCWAIWLRAIDDGKPETSEPTKPGAGRTIEPPEQNAALAKVAALFHLHIL